MALLDKNKEKVSDEISTAGLADIVFLLLIFFLVTTVFPKDKGLAIVLPESEEQAEVSQNNILHLLVQPSGVVDVRRGESQQTQQMRPDDIEQLWRQEVADNPNLIAAVKTHREAPYRHMVDALDALHQAGAERISLQVLEE